MQSFSESPGLSASQKVKSDALRLLAVRPRSVEELRQRLRSKKHDDIAIDSVIETLKKQGILDDEKFARLFAGSRVHSKPVGRRQLEIDLKKKGLSGQVISHTMAGFHDYDEKAAARGLIENRFRRTTGLSPEKKKARLFSFLKRRGFSSDIILSVLAELIKEES